MELDASGWPMRLTHTITVEPGVEVVVLDPFCVVGHGEGQQLLVVPCGRFGWLSVFDLNTGVEIGTVFTPDEEPHVRGVVMCRAAPSTAGTVLVSRGYEVNEVRVWIERETDLGFFVRKITDNGGNLQLRIFDMAANEDVLAVLYMFGIVKFFDWENGSCTGKVHLHGHHYSRHFLTSWIALTPDSRHVVYSDLSSGVVMKVDRAGTQVWEKRYQANSLTADAEGNVVIADRVHGLVKLCADGEEIGRIPSEIGTTTLLAMASDGRLVVGQYEFFGKNFRVYSRCLKLRVAWMEAVLAARK